MTEDMLRNAKPGERVVVRMQVMRHDPLGNGLDLGTVDPVDGHIISRNFFAYQEAGAIGKESFADDSQPWTVVPYTGEHGTFRAVEKGLNHRAEDGQEVDTMVIAKEKVLELFGRTKVRSSEDGKEGEE